MTEPTFPFAGDDAADDETASAGRRRSLVLLGGVGVAGLAVLGVLALSGSDDEDLDLGLPAGRPAAAATPSPSAGPEQPAAVPAVVRGGRDPFQAPAGAAGGTAPAAGTVPDAAAPAPGAPAPAAPASPVEQPGPSQDGAAPDRAPDGAPVADEDRAATELSLLRVAADQTAVLAVDGASSSVRVGDAFGPGGSLLLLSLQQGPADGQWTAVVQQGSGDPFDVVTGQPVTLA